MFSFLKKIFSFSFIGHPLKLLKVCDLTDLPQRYLNTNKVYMLNFVETNLLISNLELIANFLKGV